MIDALSFIQKSSKKVVYSMKQALQYTVEENGIFIRKGEHKLDNRWVVPHNLKLLKIPSTY
jgi:hypothetical protein